MKSLILSSICALFLLASCSTVYRAGQTPDDVYYSPAPQPADGAAYAEASGNQRDGRRYQQSDYSGYDAYASPDDRWLMMRVRDRARWSVFDDYSYYSPYNDWSYGYGYGGYGPGLSLGFGSGFYSPYTYGLGFGYNSFYNNYYNWNSAYNPYYYNSYVVNPKVNPAGYNSIRNFNLNNYTNRNYNTSPTAQRYYNGNGQRYGTVTPSNSRSVGSSIRRAFSGTNNATYAPAQNRPVRAYTPSNNNNNNYNYTPSNNNSYSSPSRSGGGGGGGSSSSGGGSGSRPGR